MYSERRRLSSVRPAPAKRVRMPAEMLPAGGIYLPLSNYIHNMLQNGKS